MSIVNQAIRHKLISSVFLSLDVHISHKNIKQPVLFMLVWPRLLVSQQNKLSL